MVALVSITSFFPVSHVEHPKCLKLQNTYYEDFFLKILVLYIKFLD